MAEEEFSLPDVGTFELAGVVYHSGRNLMSGRYTCASRGPDRQFWRYEDAAARRSAVDVGRLLPRSVYVLVYTRPFGAAVFAGMKLLRELGTGKASAVMLSGRARGDLTASAARCGDGCGYGCWRRVSSTATLGTKD